jgi:hypothetical protein
MGFIESLGATGCTIYRTVLFCNFYDPLSAQERHQTEISAGCSVSGGEQNTYRF